MCFAIVAVAAHSQSFTGKIQLGNTYVGASLSSFVLTNTDTVDVVVTVNQNVPFTLDACVKLDSISGNPTGTVYVLGRKASTESWSAIANTVWGTNDDDVIVSHTTAVRYRELLIRYINGGTGVTQAKSYWVKVWQE